MTEADNKQYKKCVEESHGMCFICKRPAEQIHHAYGGANRDKSTKYGLLFHLCADCHDNAHRLRKVREMLRTEARFKFALEHPELDFSKIFSRCE